VTLIPIVHANCVISATRDIPPRWNIAYNLQKAVKLYVIIII